MKINVVVIGSNQVIEFPTANDYTIDNPSGMLTIWQNTQPGMTPEKNEEGCVMLAIFPRGTWALLLDDEGPVYVRH